jgi:hypothetical protein
MQQGMVGAIGAPRVEGFSATIKEAVQMAMHVFAEEMDVIDDLKVALVRNRTGTPFITSDDPAVMTNRWYLEDGRVHGKSPGLGSAGVIALLPLSPEVLCLIYDGDVYSVPHTNGWVDVKREADIQAFNQHQYLNCTANVYFRDWENRQWMHEAFLAARPLRPAARHRTHYAVYDGKDGNTERFRVVHRVGTSGDGRALIHSEAVLARPNIWPWQIAWRAGGSAFTNGTGAGVIRRAMVSRQRSVGFRKIKTR